MQNLEEVKIITKLQVLICDDKDRYSSTQEALELLKKQDEIDGSVMADDIVLMWENVENSFTVSELLDEIGL